MEDWNTFAVSYSIVTFKHGLRVGTFDVDAPDITIVQNKAMSLILSQLRESFDEDDEDFEDEDVNYISFIHSIKVDVTEK